MKPSTTSIPDDNSNLTPTLNLNPNPSPDRARTRNRNRTRPSESQLSTLNSQLSTRNRHYRTYFRAIVDQINSHFAHDSWRWRIMSYRSRPAAFAREVLGSEWTAKQEEIARMVRRCRRVAVKSANGVGKTYLAADLALWFLYTHENSIVLTIAPTNRQVRFALWKEIHARLRTARLPSRQPANLTLNPNLNPNPNLDRVRGRTRTRIRTRPSNPQPSGSLDAAPLRASRALNPQLPGRAYATRLQLQPDWYAVGLSSDTVDNLQGFHAEHLLIIIEEASGIPEPFWAALETMAVADNNKIVAIGNPLRASGRFYRIFTRALGWKPLTLSALDHPNIRGRAKPIPGCVTPAYIQDRINDWCEPILADSDLADMSDSSDLSDNHQPSEFSCAPLVRAHETINHQPVLTTPHTGDQSAPDVITHEGRKYRPNSLFRARVQGEFPSADDDSLIPLRWIEAASRRTLPKNSHRRMAADIARFGDDKTVIGIRHGPVITKLLPFHGLDTTAIAGHINRLAYEVHPEAIAVDSIGIGAGVVDRLYETGTEGVEAINVSLPAYDPERFLNRRAELYWGLRDRFRIGDIDIPDNDLLIEELSQIRYQITSRGQIRIESKDEIKKRLGRSPDYADTVALLFDGAGAALFTFEYTRPLGPSAAQQLRDEMKVW